jgi:HD-like signal output (HDOD) protein
VSTSAPIQRATLPDRSPVAVTVIRLTDDPDASAVDLAHAIGADAVFTARILRVANSAYYGLAGRVSTLPYAVSVLGFRTIRALAVVAATGFGTPNTTPVGFWQAAATTACAGELVAPALGADSGDAFCLGLLHILGAAVLHQQQPLPCLCLPLPQDAAGLLQVEDDRYGTSHDLAGAQLLDTWSFPRHITALIVRHHQPLLSDASPLERTLHVARALTHQLLMEDNRADRTADQIADGHRLDEPADSVTAAGEAPSIEWLTDGRLTRHDTHPLLAHLRQRTPHLLDSLQPGAAAAL